MSRERTNRVKTNLMLDEDVHDKVRLYLTDPRTNRLRYGSLQAITNHLLRRFFQKMLEPGVDPIQLLAAYGVDLRGEAEYQPQEEQESEHS